MTKKTVTYKDYNDVERTEDFYFNLTKAEIVEMNFETTGGLEGYINRIISEQDNTKIAALFKTILLKSYGIKSPDGKRFMKNDEIRAEFEQSAAYTEIYMGLLMDADGAADFFKKIIPADLQQASNHMTVPTIK